MADDDGAYTPGASADARPDDGPSVDAGARPEGDALAELRAELDAVKDRMLRDRAELENFKKRTARERAEALRYAEEGLLRDLLPVVDNLERALDHAVEGRQSDPLIQGIELVLRQFSDVLERHGVKPVDALGTSFDPTHHEAIRHVESAEPANTVIGEHQRGYTLHDRLLRPAMVTVGKGPARDGSARRVETASDDD